MMRKSTIFLFVFLCTFSIVGAQWSEGTPMETPRSELTATYSEGKIYVAGALVGGMRGFASLDLFTAYDVESDRWEVLAPAPISLHHTVLTSWGGNVYLSGGYSDNDFNLDVASFWEYDSGSDSWSALTEMPAPRGAHTMQAMDGKIYVTGGAGRNSRQIWVYDIGSDVWTIAEAELSESREHLTSVVIEDKLYIIGGRWRENSGMLEVYDPESDTVMRLEDMPTPRGGLTASALDGRIHVTGGEAFSPMVTFDEHEVYDPETDTWETLEPLPTPRHGLTSVAIGNQWYVIGGARGAGGQTTRTLEAIVEIYTIDEDS